ncbi:hypothetical protein SPACI_050580 [Sporomusa acidovorans DSM 3132]|uniref:Uncharacterized protein n=1 Tax=Sporomusa acidovorans (strain ATCC 49682 / DSM 3132 / Mol) TaxID=1123286 RepID=A0ABZ3J953_SPOA4|nr:hypothetical protein SPACI_10420 [Sporomusa acidovorans DSM 3132]SDE93726.1 hypothetical protein SAMN04488499_102711 [Sporomusa acidovorans]
MLKIAHVREGQILNAFQLGQSGGDGVMSVDGKK